MTGNSLSAMPADWLYMGRCISFQRMYFQFWTL